MEVKNERMQQAVAQIIPETSMKEPQVKELLAVANAVIEAFSEAAQEVSKPEASIAALATVRRRIAEAFKMPNVPDDDVSPEKYQNLVAYVLGMALLLTAREPTTPRAEVDRFIEALKTIRKGYKAGTREPGDDVKTALKMLEKRGWRGEIYSKAIPGYDTMDEDLQKIRGKELREKVGSLKRTRRLRANKKSQ
jgi:hypothetical protein